MIQLARWKVVLVVTAAVLGLLFTLPNFLSPQQREALPGWLPNRTVNLGLDLRGGSQLLLEVDTEALLRERMVNLTEDMRRLLREAGTPFGQFAQGPGSVTVRINEPAQVEAAYTALNRLGRVDPTTGLRDITITRGPDQTLTATLSAEAMAAEGSQAVAQSIEIIRRRVDALGTTEPVIQRQGVNRIVVQAPGEGDPQRLRDVIGRTAKLSFHALDETAAPEQIAAGVVSPGSMIVQGPETPPIAVQRRSIVTGEMLTGAQATFDQNQQPAVSLTFNSEGARRFGRYTTDNVGRTFAILLDDQVISTAYVREPIPGGNGQISNMGSTQRASDLAILLRAGALPAPLEVIQQSSVGATLGADSVRAGAIATTAAFCLVLVIMVLLYGGLFGGISIVALLVNGLMIMAAMSIIGASLTLPGIAGLILTLAMAVDANVLIYERMRDEARAGRTAVTAADAGFSRAMVTIIDSQLTTLLAAGILFYFGAGPVQGFAWTLSLGVFTSVFTAVLVTQVLLGLWFRLKRPKALPIS